MAYATRAEMYQLAVNSGAFTGIATADQDAALDGASVFADGYLTQRFQLPLTSYGQDLKEAVANIAAYRIIAARGFSPEDADADQLRLRYQDAIGWLRDVSAGKVTPTNVADSSGVGTTAADELKTSPTVVQYRPASTAEDEADSLFVKSTTTLGGVGPPKPRGW
jgi:phage gp36-like protein